MVTERNKSKHNDDMEEERTEHDKEDALAFFSNDKDKILTLLTELQKNVGSFTPAKVSEILGVNIGKAVDAYGFLLQTIHRYAEHGISLESIKKDMISYECDADKVNDFVRKLGTLDQDTKRCVEVLMFASLYVEDFPQISGVSSSVLYEVMRKSERQPEALLPIVRIILGLVQGEEKEVTNLDLYIPITEIGQLVKALQEIQSAAKQEVRTLKRGMTGKLFVPEGE